jgi:hypothetical protein
MKLDRIEQIKNNLQSMENILDELYNLYYTDLSEDDLPLVIESIKSMAHNIVNITNIISK